MGSGGFSVDLNALDNAGQGIKDLIGLLDQHKVEDIDCDSGAVGHDGLAGKLDSFCGRWQVGVENLVEDGQQIAQRLLNCAAAYRQHDQSAANAFGGGGSDG